MVQVAQVTQLQGQVRSSKLPQGHAPQTVRRAAQPQTVNSFRHRAHSEVEGNALLASTPCVPEMRPM